MSSGGVVVLMYHGVGDEPAAHAELRYTVSEPTFRAHLDTLAARPVVSLERLLYGRAPDGAVVLSFDDGERSVATRVAPLLRERSLPAVLFVTTGWIGEPGYCDERDLRQLAEAGWELGAHGVTHCFLSELPDSALARELGEARERLRQILGRPPRYVSLPGGRGDARVRQAARAAGYLALCTSVIGRNGSPPSDPFAVRRVMVQRGQRASWVSRLAAGDRRLLLELRARQELFDGAKQLLGNERYVALRAAAAKWLRR
jgi:peptidoglycan/xylan/chitin deacetylase (PgdA/CDA1 family)